MSEKAKVDITRADLEQRNYGWGFTAHRYNATQCGESVYAGGYLFQCRAKPKPGSLWCDIHSPEAEAKREAKWNARYEMRAAANRQMYAERTRRDALAAIAPELAKAVRTLRGLAVAEAYGSLGELLDRYDSIVGKADSGGGACDRP